MQAVLLVRGRGLVEGGKEGTGFVLGGGWLVMGEVEVGELCSVGWFFGGWLTRR